MRPLASLPGPAALVSAVALVCAIGASPALRPADAAPKRGREARASRDTVRAERPVSRVLAVSRTTPDEAAMRLGRAAMERSVGNTRGVVENLSVVDFSVEPSFADADRAAFLLGQAYLETGGRSDFVTLARQVATWRRSSPYTRWIAYQLAMTETETPGKAAPARSSRIDTSGIALGPAAPAPAAGGDAADALAAGVLLRDGDPAGALRLVDGIEARGGGTPLVTYLRAQALDATGGDPLPAWSRLAGADTSSRLGRDLAGAALIRLATEALRRSEDARPLLERVPARSRFGARARHMLGLASLERGDTTRGAAELAALGGDSSYAGRREVWLALAGRALDRADWSGAYGLYREIDRDWKHHRDVLQRLLASGDVDSLWRAWETNGPLSPALMLDALPARMLAEGLADSAEDLRARPAPGLPALEAPDDTAAAPWTIPPPPAEAWRSMAGAARDLGEASHALTHTHWAMARERESLDGLRRYLDGGLTRARTEVQRLNGYTSLLDSLHRALQNVDARLRAVRDEATRRVLERTRIVLHDCMLGLLWISAMRHYHLDGPERTRAVPPPAGYPGPDSLIAGEEALTRAIEAMARRLAAQAPDLIARSYAQAWRPGMIDRAAAQDAQARAALARARRLAASIDSSLAATSGSATLRRLAARADSLEQATATLRAAYDALRREGARTAIRRALAGLDAEREAVDYGLAASTYGLGVRLAAAGPGDSLAAAARPARAAAAAAPGDSTAVDPLDEPDAVRWRTEAVGLHRTFLTQHGRSPARGEIRFRLADLLLVEARREFREQMAAYVKDQAAGGQTVRLPVLSHAEPLRLYRAILAEDPGFEHRDAALFNAGMILADEGSPEARQMFDRLVTEYPQSAYVQEATLRMGDMEFNEKRYAASIGLYRRAAAGPDPGLTAIALYKTGWAHYNQDQFADAARAFGAVLDLYGSPQRPEIEADVEGEAETYLVHSLAGAGGAPAFEAHFGAVGQRPYALRVLMALGQHFRRFGLYDDAVAVDELALRRYPESAEALLSAQRIIDTHQRARQPDRAREARLGFSARFAPGGAWAKAQSSDSLRAAGEQFSRSSLRTVAQEYHQRARQTRAAADWRAALDLYQQVLAAWPDDPEAPTTALKAGEAASQLGEYPTALGHYERAARAGSDSVAAQAMWQRVAVTDAWYERTRGDGAARAATGRDSLARAVLRNADELLARFPEHPQGPDLMWRQGNLAYAHGWLDESSRHFGTLAARHPKDARAPRAAMLRADALFKQGRFEAAAPAYEQALVVARDARADSLARRAAQSIPVAYYRQAEAAVAEDSSRFERHAELFQQVATRWPHYEHAHLAQYRAGIAWTRAGKTPEAVRALQAVIDSFPRSEYVRDAHLEIARAWEKDGAKEKSAAAYARLAERYPGDKGAPDAWLKAADLYAAGGRDDQALRIRLGYIKRYPNDAETAMEVYEALALKELQAVSAERPISKLLPAPVAPAKKAAGKAGRKSRAAAKAPRKAAAPDTMSYLAEYLRRAQTHPKLASRAILAQVAYLQAEESRPSYEALRIRQPLPPSIAAKQKSLDRLMALYKQSVDHGVPEWAHASTYRIGEALVSFGTALEKSQRPPDLTGDGLDAYEEVLMERADQFAARGEGVWSELLRQKGATARDDPWIVKAQGALWQRLGDRFTYRAEADYPLVGAREVDKKRPADTQPEKRSAGRRDRDERPQSQNQEDRPR